MGMIHKKYYPVSLVFSLFFILVFVFCSKDEKPSLQEAQLAITSQLENELTTNQKIADIDILNIGETGYADFEAQGSNNLFWVVDAEVKLKQYVTQKKFLKKKKRIAIEKAPLKRKFRVWKNKSGSWMATPFSSVLEENQKEN